MAKKFKAEEHIVALNALRIQLINTTFNSSMIRAEFKNCGIPSNMLFWTVFCNSGLIGIVGKDLYCFKDFDKPIHFRRLGEIYKEYQTRVNSYHNKWNDKRKHKDILKRSDIQAAIKLLQDNGIDVVININKLYHNI